jgi:hypothetical protein
MQAHFNHLKTGSIAMIVFKGNLIIWLKEHLYWKFFLTRCKPLSQYSFERDYLLMNDIDVYEELIMPGKLKSATILTCTLTILFFLFFDQSKHNPALAAVNPFIEDPYDAVGSFGIQLSLLAALLSLIRVFRSYATKEIPSNQLLLILRGDAIALLSMIVTLAADIVAMLRYPSMWMNSSDGRILAGLVGSLLLLTLFIGLLLYRIVVNLSFFIANHSWKKVVLFPISLFILAIYPANLRESVAGGIFTASLGMVLLFISTWSLATAIFLQTEMEFEAVFDDFASIYRGIKARLGFVSRVENFTNIAWLHKLFNWLNPRKHRWNFIILIALVMGGSLMLTEALNEGISTNTNIVMLVLAVFLGIEGAGVILGYLLFAEFLGIFRKS